MPNTPQSRPKVFGIGLSRTGTKSLATALNQLGVRTIWYPQDALTFAELSVCKYRLSILESYDGITDTPVVPIYPQLDAEFPGSKFILTTRNIDAWIRSCSKHWGNSPIAVPPDPNAPMWQQYAAFVNATVYGCVGFHSERFRYVYHRHVEGVRSYFRDRPDDLLEIDLTAEPGWQSLCRFLGKQVPSGPLPHVNAFDAKTLS
ncbi:sulfotransferase family protein [Rhodopirellula bahusiensis]|uniref:sulfotransferase family protein n=1 Tax=Rhodopirellula bahusiensis TaxID=2014065 RepID=UPI0032653AC0